MIPILATAAGGLYYAYIRGHILTGNYVSSPCANPLNSDWGIVEDITKVTTKWTQIRWQGRIICYEQDGKLVERDGVHVIALDGCPGAASLASVIQTRQDVDAFCDGPARIAKLADPGIGNNAEKMLKADGTVLMIHRDNLLKSIVLPAGEGNRMEVSEEFAHKPGSEWAPMASDLWVPMMGRGPSGEVLFSKVHSFFHYTHHYPLVLETPTVEETLARPENRARLELHSKRWAKMKLVCVRIPSPFGDAGADQVIRGGWGQVRIAKATDAMTKLRGRFSPFVGVHVDCYREKSGWVGKSVVLPVPMTQWAVDEKSQGVPETMALVDKYCLTLMAGREIRTDIEGLPLVFAEHDVMGSIVVDGSNDLTVSSSARVIQAGHNDWNQDAEGRWTPKTPKAWVALVGKGPKGGILFHRVGTEAVWPSMMSAMVPCRQRLCPARSGALVQVRQPANDGIKLEGRMTTPTSNVMEVTSIREAVVVARGRAPQPQHHRYDLNDILAQFGRGHQGEDW